MVETFGTVPSPVGFSGGAATVGFQVPIPVGVTVTSGAWYVTGNPYQSLGINLSINSIAVFNGVWVSMDPTALYAINHAQYIALSYEYYEPLSFSVNIIADLVGNFPPPPPTGPVTPPWPGPPEWPGYPGWPIDPTDPVAPYPGWPGGTKWPGYSNWFGNYGGSGWQSWGSILTRDAQGDYSQAHRRRGENESAKLNSIVKSAGTDAQTGLIQVKYLGFLDDSNAEAAYISEDYALRHLQHFRVQLSWRVNLT